MTVCLTGDVHHMSLSTRDQDHMTVTELEAAAEYADIAASYELPVTLFVTGKAALEEPNRTKQLAENDHVEVGGHNYWAFGTPLHTVFRGLFGSWNGPRRFQSWEIGRTIDALTGVGASVRSWRDHAYRHDHHTLGLLCDHGVTHVSDTVGPDFGVGREAGVTTVPINTPPDHEHVYHAFRGPGSQAVEEFEGPFGGESVSPDEWVEWVLNAVKQATDDGRSATILAHPSCMRLADKFDAFDQLCRALADYDCRRVRALQPD